MKNSRFWEVLLKVIVAAATAAITALTTTSCMGCGFKEERGLTDIGCCRSSFVTLSKVVIQTKVTGGCTYARPLPSSIFPLPSST